MAPIKNDEKVHLIERRLFPDDVRRHFLGTVVGSSEHVLRIEGYLFVYDTSSGTFLKKPEIRVRLIPLDNRVIINVLPDSVVVEDLRYERDADGNLSLLNGAGFDLDISEFSPKE